MHSLTRVRASPLLAISYLGICAFGEYAHAADAGVWISLRTPEGEQPVPPCPDRIYLGGRGESYAEGIRRTGNFRPFAQGGVSVSVPELGRLRYTAQVMPAFENCSASGSYQPGIFVGESYTYHFRDSELALEISTGSSLRIESRGVFKMQPIFDVFENL
jgi:hypothetical protein